jgi:aminopeptidase N
MSHQTDPTSLSNPLDVKVVSSHLAIRVDFTKNILAGYVDHRTEVLQDGSAKLVLDSKALNIKNVSLVQQAEDALGVW